jgi:hypothetical protein
MLVFVFASFALSRVHRVLVIQDSNTSDSKDFSLFFNDLSSLGCDLTYTLCESTPITLERFGERLYDTVVILCGKSSCFSNSLDELTRYLDNGGNAYVFSSRPPQGIQEKLYRHFNLRVTLTSAITDIFGDSEVVLRNFLAPPAIVSHNPGPLLYEGGFGTLERPNDFRIPIISGGIEHVTRGIERAVGVSVHAHDLLPIYALQGRTGGRVVFVHSATFATDGFIGATIARDEKLQLLSKELPNGNRQLLKELSEYVTHYKSHARIVAANHFATLTGKTPVQYHIRQNVTVVADLESVSNREWMRDSGTFVQSI